MNEDRDSGAERTDTYSVLDTTLATLLMLPHLTLATIQGDRCGYSHFGDEKPEAQEMSVTCSRSIKTERNYAQIEKRCSRVRQ